MNLVFWRYFYCITVPFAEIAKANKRQATKTYSSVWGFKKKGNMHEQLLFQNELKLWGGRYTNRHHEARVQLIYRREIYMGNSHWSSDNLYAKTHVCCLGNKPAISDCTDTLVGNTTSALWHLPTHTCLRGMSKKNHCHRECFFLNHHQLKVYITMLRRGNPNVFTRLTC